MDTGIKISIIAAVADNGVIGNKGDIPWHLPEDLKRFAQLTKDHTVIMGRNTYESILKRLGHPLRERRSIVLTRNKDYPFSDGILPAGSWTAAMEYCSEGEEVFAIGGFQLYQLTLLFADRMYLTHVHAEIEGDTLFPFFDRSDWETTITERHYRDATHLYNYTFKNLRRKWREPSRWKNS